MLRALHCNYSQYPRGAQHWTENCGVDIQNIEMSPGQPTEVVTVEAMVSVLRGGTLSTATTLSLSGHIQHWHKGQLGW